MKTDCVSDRKRASRDVCRRFRLSKSDGLLVMVPERLLVCTESCRQKRLIVLKMACNVHMGCVMQVSMKKPDSSNSL